MTDRPIIMQANSVRAILDGRKTQTRRVVKLREFQASTTRTYDWMFRDRRMLWNDLTTDTLLASRFCPYRAGDRLWVKEAWKSNEGSCNEEPQEDDHECGPHCHQVYVYYRATPRVGFRPTPDSARITYLDESSPLTEWYETGWRSAMYMPRWASRLTLVVSSVRVERVQDITEADAHAEGCESDADAARKLDYLRGAEAARALPSRLRSARGDFSYLWDAINGKRAPWSSNPYVWRVEFSADEGRTR